ncbi:MAG TPA: hypothetical protein DIC52_02275 [Candidatus Latescibacteria bacterium]|nr:hypothetical protein [Candidatus Latescibacterota bacterium]
MSFAAAPHGRTPTLGIHTCPSPIARDTNRGPLHCGTDHDRRKSPEAPRKRSRRRRRRRRQPVDRSRLWTIVALVAILLFGIIGTIAFDDRHWRAFDDAGDVAFKRGNFDYAERMYKEALQVTQELEDQRLVRASQEALSRA